MITAEHPDSSLRERKKLATRRRLRRVALDLFAERGYSNVTAEEIAEAAEVSTRTFFNYFPSKEAVLLSADPDRLAHVRESVMAAAPGTPPIEVLHQALKAWAGEMVAQLAELGGDPADWLRRMKAARTDLHLRAAQASQMEAIVRSGPIPSATPIPGCWPCWPPGCSGTASGTGPAPAAACRWSS